MKIYFTASINNPVANQDTYQQIVNFLEKKGHEVFQEVLAQNLIKIREVTSQNIKYWYKKWSTYISECDFAVVEASYPSTVHIGFEIGLLLTKGKPVILLHQEQKDPVYINDFYSNKLIKCEYSQKDLVKILNWALKEVDKISNRRFTFFIPPEIDNFLDKISQKKKISRSEYIRALIEEKISQQ
jgi:nucleoside 2-deoxyribosyltransferase